MSSANKVLIGPSSFAEKDRSPYERLEAAGMEVIDNPFARKLTKEELLGLLGSDVAGLIAGLEPLDREVQGRSSLKVISRVGSGMSNVDQVAAKELGIAVHSTPDGPTESVAELTLGALLALLRQIPAMDSDLHAGRWNKKIGFELAGKTVLIVGFGRIGRRVSELLSPFGVRQLIVDPAMSGPLPESIMQVTLEEGLAQADVITLHASGEACLLGAAQFRIMKSGAFLLNVARGGLVDEVELALQIKQGKVAGAWLDTFGKEPYQGPLAHLDRVLLTPHVGSYTGECRLRMEMEAVENLLAALGRA